MAIRKSRKPKTYKTKIRQTSIPDEALCRMYCIDQNTLDNVDLKYWSK
jgi:hypothetical protein